LWGLCRSDFRREIAMAPIMMDGELSEVAGRVRNAHQFSDRLAQPRGKINCRRGVSPEARELLSAQVKV